jgi:hypothetical protein
VRALIRYLGQDDRLLSWIRLIILNLFYHSIEECTDTTHEDS